jgi:cobalamin biosynthesis Mg chelatase CobN
MRSKPNSDSVRTTATSGSSPSSGSGYAPSVPISVYRELAAELQATKTLLDSLNHQNQQLTHYNQQLRQEIERVMQSTLSLHQMAESQQPSTWSAPSAPQHPEMVPEMVIKPSRPAVRAPRPVASEAIAPKNRHLEAPIRSDELFSEQQEARPRVQTEAAKEVGGIWIALIILAIVITAFGAGFMVVRPLLSPNR